MHAFRVLSLYVAVTLLLPCSSHAENMAARTVEWLVCASDVVAVGKITRIKTVKGPGDVFYEDCVLTVTESINNASAQTIPFCYRRFSSDSVEWLSAGGEFLVCLSIHKAAYDEARMHLYTDPDYETRLHNLLMPTSQNFPRSIIQLASPERFVMSNRSELLTTKDQVLATARSAAEALRSYRATHPKAAIRESRIPAEGEAAGVLYGGSATSLIVPEFMVPAPQR